LRQNKVDIASGGVLTQCHQAIPPEKGNRIK